MNRTSSTKGIRRLIKILILSILLSLIAMILLFKNQAIEEAERITRIYASQMNILKSENDELVSYIESSKETPEMSSDELLSYEGEFRVTAYCSCSICCGVYAKNRPIINSKEVVFTSSGDIATQGITVAVDPSVIPYGTKIYIEGIGVRIAQDSGSAIKGNRLDIYYEDHQEAWNSGLNEERSVWIVNENS